MSNSLRRATRIGSAVLAAVAFAACGSVRYPEHYVLNFEPPVQRRSPANRPLGPITVRTLGCPAYLCEGRIVYRPTAEQVAFYEYHRWALNPREAITQLMAERLRAGAVFETVALGDNGMAAKYQLRGGVERLEEVDEGRAVYAICTIWAEVFDLGTRSVLWQGSATETVAVEQRTMAGVVTSLASASQVAVDRLVASMGSELAAREEAP